MGVYAYKTVQTREVQNMEPELGTPWGERARTALESESTEMQGVEQLTSHE